MVQKTTSSQSVPVTKTDAADPWPAEVAGVLGEVQKLLDAGRTTEALEWINRSKIRSSWLSNAVAVCQLRLGNVKVAVETLRSMVVVGGLFLREDVPAVFKVNFATALIADGNLSGGLRTLSDIRDETNPAVREIRDAVRRWEAEMSFGRKLWYWLGGGPHRPFVLDFPPGKLK